MKSAEPDQHFSIIMGSDNLSKLHEWKEIEILATLVEFHVYMRRGSEEHAPKVPSKFHYYEAPFLDLSATFIREQIALKKDVRYMLPDSVIDVLRNAGLL